MRNRSLLSGTVVAALLAACSGDPEVSVTSAALEAPAVRIAELHYDNTGTDVGEAIEVSGPAGTDLTGWQLVVYNGNGGVSYGTVTLSGVIPATCGARGVVVVNYPANGLQNGGTSSTTTGNPVDADGVALVAPGGTVVELLGYEGSFTATNGPAVGLTATDILVRENGADPVGLSLQRSAAGTWSPPAASTFGACNDAGQPPAEVASVTVAPAVASVAPGATQQFVASAFDGAGQPVPGVVFTWSSSAPGVAGVDGSGLASAVASGDTVITARAPNGTQASALLTVTASPPPAAEVRVSELHYDNDGTDSGEAVELEGDAGADLTGWSLVLYNGGDGRAYGTQALGGTIPATCGARGVVVVSYPANGLQNGPDGLALVDAGGTVVELLSYEGSFVAVDGPAAGMTTTELGAAEGTTTPIGLSLQQNQGSWYLRTSTFGECNLDAEPPPPPPLRVTITGRLATDPALPIGFQDQLFATLRDPLNVSIPTTFTWSSDTPALATVDAQGVITALAEGTATLRATAADGTSGTISLPTRNAPSSDTAEYGRNAEFGEPADGDAADDFILRHPEYTASYSVVRGTPSWVSYNINATHFGAEDRCDCFTFDPALPAAFPRYTTADYTGAGTFHGYGIDRGHLTRSFDRTAGALDNAYTFYFSNVLPQASDLNQGPWSALEMYLGDLARFQDREVYVVTGVIGSKGTLKNEGKITIPARMWKVALIMPRGRGLADVTSPADIEVIAVDMPNDPGVRNVPWDSYVTTVNAIEAASGYDVLALLPDAVEAVVEGGEEPPPPAPVAVVGGPYGSSEGSELTLSAAGSSGNLVSYQWDFGDGTAGSGSEVSHSYAQDGVYTVRLVVTDASGLSAAASTTATVVNVAPVLGALPDATLLPGESYTASGAFVDPGADAWSATVDYGSGPLALPLTGTGFLLVHRYDAAGTYPVTVRVSDDDVTAQVAATVTVLTHSRAIRDAMGLVDQLVAAGKLTSSEGKSLKNKLTAADRSVRRNVAQAIQDLQSFLAELDGLVAGGRLSATDAAPVRTLVARIVASLSGG